MKTVFNSRAQNNGLMLLKRVKSENWCEKIKKSFSQTKEIVL